MTALSAGRLVFLTFSMLATSLSLAQTPGAYLGDLSWPEAEKRIAAAALVIVPFGA